MGIHRLGWSLVPVVALVACLAGITASPSPTRADLIWCWIDPTLVVNGDAVRIQVGVPLNQQPAVGKAELTVTVPANVTAYLSGTAATSFPMAVTIVRSGLYSGV